MEDIKDFEDTTEEDYDNWTMRRFLETVAGLREDEELIVASPAKGTLVCYKAEDGLALPIPPPSYLRKLADTQAEGS